MASIIHRPTYEDVIRRHLDTPEIKILTGVRRCGKSTLLEGLAESLRARDGGPNVLYLRLDAFGMPLSPTAEWLQGQIEQAAGKADPARTFHVLLDEVQEIPAWEKVVRQLRTRPRTDTWVTGSNAHVLSSDLSTLIGGRYVQIPVYPLSFAEYRDFCHGRADAPTGEDALFAAYMRTGGMPGQFELPTRSDESLEEMLSALCDTVLINDVARHARISDVDLLTKLTRYVFSTSSNLFSTRSIARALTSAGRKTSPETVDAYVDALAKAYVITPCEQQGVAGKDVLRPLRKLYPVDNGLRNLMTGFSPRDTRFQLECVVFNELRRRGLDVRVGAMPTGEVDFVARSRIGEVTYVQVTETMAGEETYGRELAPLRAIKDSFPKVVLTLDRFHAGVTEEGIRIANVIDWLLE